MSNEQSRPVSFARLGINLDRARAQTARLIDDLYDQQIPIAEQYVIAHGIATSVETALEADGHAGVAGVLREEMEGARHQIRAGIARAAQQAERDPSRG